MVNNFISFNTTKIDILHKSNKSFTLINHNNHTQHISEFYP